MLTPEWVTGEFRIAGFRLVDHPDFLRYDFGRWHPLRPERISAGLGLLQAANLWDPAHQTLQPEAVAEDDLLLVHDRQYIAAVRTASKGRYLPGFGFGSHDNPPFEGMHEIASLMVGGAVAAARAVMEGSVSHVFHPAGGWHHALRNRAAGFCIYNDPAVAAAVLVRDFGARVLYIDLDAHHGDGVQWMFYDRREVYTVSFHESGRFLFPGTGAVDEIGSGAGEGFCLNVPFLPLTRDNDWAYALDALLPAIAEQFKPDIVISNHGCDTHAWDPITHLTLSTASLQRQAAVVHDLTEQFCAGRWLAVGSGGYEWRRVVPRSWAILWAEMTGATLPSVLPRTWKESWLIGAAPPLPEHLLDTSPRQNLLPRTEETSRMNRATVADAAGQILHSAVRGSGPVYH